MNQLNQAWGIGYVNAFLPSVRAKMYLEHLNTAGYHRVGPLYRQHYPAGLQNAMLFFTLSGEGTLSAQGRSHILSAGSVTMTPPGIPISYHCSGEEWEFYWLNLNGMRTEQLARALLAEGKECFVVRSMDSYAETLHTLLHLGGDKHTMEMSVSQTILQLEDRLLTEMFFAPTRQSLLSARIISYLEEHSDRKITLEQLSRQFYLSPNRLIEVFRAETGRTPYAYLKEYRLAKAQMLLQTTDLTAVQIAHAVGFGTASNFGYQFSRAFGLSPLEWRKCLRGSR